MVTKNTDIPKTLWSHFSSVTMDIFYGVKIQPIYIRICDDIVICCQLVKLPATKTFPFGKNVQNVQ
jgi:hypothetical protein